MKKRIRYVMKKKLQFELTARFIILIIIFGLFTTIELFITVWPVVSSHISPSEMTLIRSQILFRLSCFSLPIIFVLASFILIFSNRIAGPIYRLERTLDKFLAGENIEPIRLRKKDELKDLISKVNDVILLVKKLQKKSGSQSQGTSMKG